MSAFNVEHFFDAMLDAGFSSEQAIAMLDGVTQSVPAVLSAMSASLEPLRGIGLSKPAKFFLATVLHNSLGKILAEIDPGFPYTPPAAPDPGVDITEPLPAAPALAAIVDGPNGPELGEVLAAQHWPDSPLPDSQLAHGGACS